MTHDDCYEGRTPDDLLARLYRVAVSIEEKVEEIFEGLQELIDTEHERGYRGYDWRNGYEDNNHD